MLCQAKGLEPVALERMMNLCLIRISAPVVCSSGVGNESGEG